MRPKQEFHINIGKYKTIFADYEGDLYNDINNNHEKTNHLDNNNRDSKHYDIAIYFPHKFLYISW